MEKNIVNFVKLSHGTVSGSVLFGINGPDSDVDVFFEKKEDFDFAVELLRREGGQVMGVITKAAVPAKVETDYAGRRRTVRAEIPAEVDPTKKTAKLGGTKIDLVLVEKIFKAEEILAQKKETFLTKYGSSLCHLVQFHEMLGVVAPKDEKYILLMKERKIYF